MITRERLLEKKAWLIREARTSMDLWKKGEWDSAWYKERQIGTLHELCLVEDFLEELGGPEIVSMLGEINKDKDE